MAFVPRSRDVIRSQLLGFLQVRFAALGITVDVSPGSFLYLLVDSLAIEDEGLEAAAAAITQVILVTTAAASDLDRHGAVYGLPRETAVAATLTITVGAPASFTPSVTGLSLTSPDGLLWTPVAPTASSVAITTGSGPYTGTLTVQCQTAGSVGNEATGITFTWNSAPGGVNSTATRDSTVPSVAGTDAENDNDYRARILLRIQNRPASGNRADWVAWCEAVEGIEEAYVYPILSPARVPGTPGCVYAVVMGPIAKDASGEQNGDNPVNTRYTSVPVARAQGYIEGTNDANGNATPNGVQLRPVTMAFGDYAVSFPGTQTVDVEIQATMDGANGYPWTGSYAVDVSSTTTSLVIVGDAHTFNASALVNVGTPNIRGGYQVVPLSGGSYNSGTGKTTFAISPALPGTPSGTIYPPPPNWQALRLATFALFDAFGPGDAPSPSQRWPPTSAQKGPVLYQSALVAAIQAVPGVLYINSVVSPAGAATMPSYLTLLTLGNFIVHA